MRKGLVAILLPLLAASCVSSEASGPVESCERSWRAVHPLRSGVGCSLEAYRIRSLGLLSTVSEARAVALDLNQDGVEDNAAGALHAAFQQQFETFEAAFPERVESGLRDEHAWFAALQRCPDGEVLLQLRRGIEQSSDGLFQVEAPDGRAARGQEAAGLGFAVAGGVYSEIPAGLLVDPLGVAGEVWATGIGLQADFAINGEELVGQFGVGLLDYEEAVHPPLIAYFNSRLQAGTSEFAQEMDGNNDGVISATEFSVSSLIAATLQNPDLDLLGAAECYAPLYGDGVKESLSLSAPITATRTTVQWQTPRAPAL